jgi:DNA polymerase III delta subunit
VIHFYYGDNDFDLKRQLDAVAAQFVAKFGSDAVTKLDAGEVEPQTLLAEIVNINLFAPRRLVVVRGLDTNKAAWALLGESLDRVPDETELIVVANNPDKRTKTFKALKKLAKTREFLALKGQALVEWTLLEAASQKVEIKRDAADTLIAATSGDQWRMAAEIAKFAALNKVVDKKLVQKIVEPNLEASAFLVLDYVLGGQKAQALQEIAKLSRLEDANKFLGLLSSQVFALAATANADGQTSAEIAKDTSTHPFVIEKMLAVSRRMKPRDVARIAQIVAETDAKIKLGGDGWTLVKVALAKI